jgi:Protein of unknown function (DUF2934)
MEYEPEGFLEQAGDVLGFPLGQVAEDLNRFRDLMEQRREGDGSGEGQTEHEVTPASTGDVAVAGEAGSLDNREKQRSENQGWPKMVVAEKELPDLEGTGNGNIAVIRDESLHRAEHRSEVVSGPEAVVGPASYLSEDTKTNNDRIGAAGPTPEQIARRAYELYLERGDKPGSPHEDWLEAERQLCERSRGTP